MQVNGIGKCEEGSQLCQKESDMKRALITAAILSIMAMPAFASPNNHHSAARSKSLGYASEPLNRSLGYASEPMNRSEAIRTCNAEAEKWNNRDWETTQLTVYRDCMFKHGQPFE